MVNRRRTKKYDRRKSSRSSLRCSLRKSLKRKNSKRKSRKIVRKNKKRTRKIKQRGGENLGEVLGDINYQRAGEVCNLHIQFNTDDFQVGETEMENMEIIGKLLIFKGTKGILRYEVFDTIHAGDVYFDEGTKTIHIVFRISNDGNTDTFHKSFHVQNNSVALRKRYLVSQSKGEYNEYNEDLCILYIRSERGDVEEFPILISDPDIMERFIASMNNVDMSAPLVCTLTGIKTKKATGTARSVPLDSGVNFLEINPDSNSSGYFLRLKVGDEQVVEFSPEEIKTFDWAAGRGLGSSNPGLRITLTNSKQIDYDEVIDIKFTFKEPDEFVQLFMVEKGKYILAERKKDLA